LSGIIPQSLVSVSLGGGNLDGSLLNGDAFF